MSEASSATLAALIDRERRLLAEFLTVLEAERDALGARLFDDLLPLAERKNAACQQLGRAALARAQGFAAVGLRGEAAALAAQLRSRAPNAFPLWQELLALAAQARELNLANGAQIRVLMQHNHQALNVLLAAADQAGLYGPDGQPRAAPGGRSLGSV